MGLRDLLATLIVITLISAQASAYFVGNATVHIPAVIDGLDQGLLTTTRLNVTSGTGIVMVNSNNQSMVNESTIFSAQTAADYAAQYLGLNASKYDFSYYIRNDTGGIVDVAGPSGGLAFSLAAVSALSRKPLANNFTATGIINSDGSISEIGGVTDKVAAAKARGMDFALVPYVQDTMFEHLLYYMVQAKNNIPVVEVANVSQAMPYATGSAKPTWLTYNAFTDYHVDAMPAITWGCTQCNVTAFSNLSAIIIKQSTSGIMSLNSSFSGFSTSALSFMSDMAKLADKGYLYPAANLAFQEYENVYMLQNARNTTSDKALSVLSGIANFCESLTPPQLTTSNYEFVIGGEIRQTWANITIAQAINELNNAQTTDSIAHSFVTAAPAYGWCFAAQGMYADASAMGGNYVSEGQAMKYLAASQLTKIKNIGPTAQYVAAAYEDYNQSMYGASLYNSLYARTFYNYTSPNLTASQLIAGIDNRSVQTVGIWPYEFGANAKFLEGQAQYATSNSSELATLQQAYQMAGFASNLAALNAQISSNFVQGAAQAGSAAIDALSAEVENLYSLMLIVIVMLFAVLGTLLYIVVSLRAAQAHKGRK